MKVRSWLGERRYALRSSFGHRRQLAWVIQALNDYEAVGSPRSASFQCQDLDDVAAG